MSWNHRVVRHKEPKMGDEYLAIHEVYCMDDDGKVSCMTEEPVKLIADDLEGLEWSLKMMLKATMKPILDAENAVGEPM